MHLEMLANPSDLVPKLREQEQAVAIDLTGIDIAHNCGLITAGSSSRLRFGYYHAAGCGTRSARTASL